MADLAAIDHDRRLTLRDPGHAERPADPVPGCRSSVDRLAIKSSFLDASARGKLDEGVTLNGTVDLAGLRRQLGEWVDLGRFDLAGRARTFRDLQTIADRFENTFKATVRDLRVEGVGSSVVRRDWPRSRPPRPARPTHRACRRVGIGPRSTSDRETWRSRPRPGRSIKLGRVVGRRQIERDAVGQPIAGIEGRLAGNWSNDLPGPQLRRGQPGRHRPRSRRAGRFSARSGGTGWWIASTGELVLEPSARGGTIGVSARTASRSRASGQGLGMLRVDGSLVRRPGEPRPRRFPRGPAGRRWT